MLAAEAAMVGACWRTGLPWWRCFAAFLIPFISRHGDYSLRTKTEPAKSGQFVQGEVPDTQSPIAPIRRHEPALLIGNWFSQPDNASRVGQHLLQIMSGFRDPTDDARIQRLLAASGT